MKSAVVSETRTFKLNKTDSPLTTGQKKFWIGCVPIIKNIQNNKSTQTCLWSSALKQ